MHAAGARRSRATGSSFGMNSRAPQRADELAGADPANRAPLAHPRQLAGRSWPRVRRRGARFGDGLETDHLNGRPGGREATRCAVRPLRGAGEHQSIGHPGRSTRGFDTTVCAPSILYSPSAASGPPLSLLSSGGMDHGRPMSQSGAGCTLNRKTTMVVLLYE